MYTKIIQNTNFVYNLYTKIVQIKIFYDNECTKNVQTVQNLYKVQAKNSFKLEMYVFCTYKQYTNYIKTYTASSLKRPLYVFYTDK